MQEVKGLNFKMAKAFDRKHKPDSTDAVIIYECRK
jgi:hypothetical protein